MSVDESATVGPHLRERQGSGETHADVGPCWEDHRLRGSQPPLAQGTAGRRASLSCSCYQIWLRFSVLVLLLLKQMKRFTAVYVGGVRDKWCWNALRKTKNKGSALDPEFLTFEETLVCSWDMSGIVKPCSLKPSQLFRPETDDGGGDFLVIQRRDLQVSRAPRFSKHTPPPYSNHKNHSASLSYLCLVFSLSYTEMWAISCSCCVTNWQTMWRNAVQLISWELRIRGFFPCVLYKRDAFRLCSVRLTLDFKPGSTFIKCLRAGISVTQVWSCF